MTKKYYKSTTRIDQSEIVEPEQWQNTSNMVQLKEDITFLAGALRCTIELDDKSKVPSALELCIELVRSIYQQVGEVTQ